MTEREVGSVADTVGTALSGLFILLCFSYLFRPGRAFTYAERLYVGFGAAQAVVVGFDGVRQFVKQSAGSPWGVFPLVMGLLLYTRYKRSWSHLAGIPMAFMMGVAAGVTITGVIDAQFIRQVQATILPLNSLDNIVLVVGTVSTLAFFLFIPLKSRANGQLERIQKGAAGLGRATIMVALGSSYGFTVMARLSYLIARLQFLLGTWVRVLPH